MTSATHNLKHNGAAYNDAAELIYGPTVTAGAGRALCTCGILSEELPSGGARRAWHKTHKLAALDAEAAAEKAETEAIMGQDVLADTPADEVEEALAELVQPAPKAPRKAKKPAETPGVDDAASEPNAYTRTVPFTENLAKHFWLSLGHAGADMVAEHYPVQVTHKDATRTVTLTGPAEEVDAAADKLAAMFEACAPAFATWKKENAEYKGLAHTTLEGRKASYQLTKGYMVDFAHKYFQQ